MSSATSRPPVLRTCQAPAHAPHSSKHQNVTRGQHCPPSQTWATSKLSSFLRSGSYLGFNPGLSDSKPRPWTWWLQQANLLFVKLSEGQALTSAPKQVSRLALAKLS